MTSTADTFPNLHVTLQAAPDPLIGTTIDGRYLVEGMLGEGGMGLVYRVRHVVLKRPLAIKVLRPEVSANPQVLARFRQEAQSASAIGNQHIIDVVDFGLLPDGSTYFVMEFLDGSPLSKVIEREVPLSIPRFIHIAKQLCDALGAAHGVGIVHRDLKPDNIFLVRRGSEADFVKVLDFGIAKVGGSTSKLTQQGQVFGTPHYMAPEQCQGMAVDGRSDIYALGIILYELITGALPFESETLVGIITAHLTELPPLPSIRRPDCPPGLEAILLRCLEKNPADRYPDCRALFSDLDAFSTGLPSWVPPRVSGIIEARVSRSDAPVAGAKPQFSVASGANGAGSQATPNVLGSRMVVILAGVISILGITAFGYAAYVATRPPPTTHGFVLPTIPQFPIAPPPSASPPAPAAQTSVSATIRIETEPVGAEVLSNGELVGITPVDLPRPTGSERRELVIRALGRETRTVTVTSSTLGSVLRFTLGRASGSSRPPHASAPSATPESTPAAQTPQPIQDSPPPRRRPSSEVINPWAN